MQAAAKLKKPWPTAIDCRELPGTLGQGFHQRAVETRIQPRANGPRTFTKASPHPRH